MHHVGAEGDGCPGCGGKGHRMCGIRKCAAEHGGVEFCFQCSEYPCERYETVSEYDSFISYRNVLNDFAKAAEDGIEAYQAELNEKVEILQLLLENYNDGRRKTFFCQAVNLLELADIKMVLGQLEDQIKPRMTMKEKGAGAAALFQAMADERGISLKLRRKPK